MMDLPNRRSRRAGLGARVVVLGDESSNAVLLDDDILVVARDHLLDLDVLMTISKQEVGAVLPDPLVLGQGQREALEAAARRALANELERLHPPEAARNAADVLVERPEQ